MVKAICAKDIDGVMRPTSFHSISNPRYDMPAAFLE
jgi:hypothetical protein